MPWRMGLLLPGSWTPVRISPEECDQFARGIGLVRNCHCRAEHARRTDCLGLPFDAAVDRLTKLWIESIFASDSTGEVPGMDQHIKCEHRKNATEIEVNDIRFVDAAIVRPFERRSDSRDGHCPSGRRISSWTIRLHAEGPEQEHVMKADHMFDNVPGVPVGAGRRPIPAAFSLSCDSPESFACPKMTACCAVGCSHMRAEYDCFSIGDDRILGDPGIPMG